MLATCNKLEVLNISSNCIATNAFLPLLPAICESKSLRLFEAKYNNLEGAVLDGFVRELKSSKNKSLLYVELAGNKFKKNQTEKLELLLKENRGRNPITKEKLLLVANEFGRNH